MYSQRAARGEAPALNSQCLSLNALLAASATLKQQSPQHSSCYQEDWTGRARGAGHSAGLHESMSPRVVELWDSRLEDQPVLVGGGESRTPPAEGRCGRSPLLSHQQQEHQQEQQRSINQILDTVALRQLGCWSERGAALWRTKARMSREDVTGRWTPVINLT